MVILLEHVNFCFACCLQHLDCKLMTRPYRIWHCTSYLQNKIYANCRKGGSWTEGKTSLYNKYIRQHGVRLGEWRNVNKQGYPRCSCRQKRGTVNTMVPWDGKFYISSSDPGHYFRTTGRWPQEQMRIFFPNWLFENVMLHADLEDEGNVKLTSLTFAVK